MIKPMKWLIRGIAAVAALGAVAVSTLFALLWWEHRTTTTLPAPTGHFAVGRTTYNWVNDAETDELSPTAGAKREVLVWIWYPAKGTSPGAPTEYLPAEWRSALAKSSGVLMSDFLTRDMGKVRTHSTDNLDISAEQRSYPVVIMRAGGGALTTDFTTLAEDLASHGYVVVGFDAPHRTGVVVLTNKEVVPRSPASDPENLGSDEANRLINRLLPMWVSDTKFVVSQLQQLNADDPNGKFTGRLDMQRLGMFGHSFGGAQTLQFCHDDARCKAGIDIDGAPYGSVVLEGVKQPFMFIVSEHKGEEADPASREIGANIHSIYDRLPNGRFFITIRGANHFSFSDQMLVKSRYGIRLLCMLGFGCLDGRRGLAITTDCVHTFFDVYLKGEPSTELTSISQRYPEIQTQ